MISDAQCSNCGLGRFGTENASTSFQVCKDCPTGKYSNRLLARECIPCPVGREATWKRTPECSRCSPGKVRLGNESACHFCPLASQYAGLAGDSCFECGRGEFVNKNRTGCARCPVGTYSELDGASTVNACKACPSGRFGVSLGVGSESGCIGCAAGRYSSILRATSETDCKACDAGKYGSHIAMISLENCTVCPRGYHQPIEGATSCFACGVGKHGAELSEGVARDTEGRSCTSCPPGKYSSVVGIDTRDKCVPCPPGTWSAASGASSDATCKPCREGTYSDKPGQNSCTLCKTGKVTNGTGKTFCSSCRAGEELLNNALFCTPCSVGKFALAAQSCGPCNPGSYPNDQRKGCVPCMKGKYASQVAIASSSQCFKCAEGRYSTVAGLDSKDKCVQCNPGRKGIGEGQSSADSCIACAAGKYNDEPGQTSCRNCSPGRSTDGSEGQTFCGRCPSGKAPRVDGGHPTPATATTCTLCPPGFYAETGAHACQKCRNGSYTNANQSGCISCDPGKYGKKEGALSEADGCIDCPSGRYGVATGISSLVQCSKCPMGEFNPMAGSTTSKSCQKCPEGRYANEYGLSFCKICSAVGKYCYAGATKITDCDTEKLECNGTSKRPREPAPDPPRATKTGKNEVVVNIVASPSLPAIAELAVSKEAKLVGAENATRIVHVPSGVSSFNVSGLNLGTSYYARLRYVDDAGIHGMASEWSDAVMIPCPEGADCVTGDGIEGLPISQIFPKDEYFRITWAGDNITFARCNSSGKRCRGGALEGCADGTTGPFCTECLPNYARSGPGNCDQCMDPVRQNLVFLAGAVLGLTFVAYIVNRTLTAKGSPSDVSVSFLKVGMRHFQLVSMASSFPLEWPVEIGSMFAFMNTASSAGDQAVALDCQLGSHIDAGSESLFFGSVFATKTIAGYLFPPILVTSFALFWVLYFFLVEGRQFGDKRPGMSSLKTRLIVSTLVLAMMFHPTITKATFEFFKCSNEVAGRSLLKADMRVICGSPYHSRLLFWVAGPGMIFYVIGIPIAALSLLYGRREILHDPSSRQK